jgi:IclR family pca regulon transcriptional regulator
MGRVLLAAASPAQVDEYVAQPLRRMTDLTVVDPDRIKDVIQRVRMDGYATAVDQLAYGVTSISVPVVLTSGETIAAVNSSGYTGRLTPDILVRTRLAALRGMAERLAQIFARYPAFVRSLSR